MRVKSIVSAAAVAILVQAGFTAESAAAGLTMPAYETATLKNGMSLQIMHHATVPLVSVEMWFRAGAVADPAGKEGLAALTAEALRKGSGSLNAKEFAQAIDFLGANFGTSVNQDRVRVSMTFMAKDWEAAMKLFSNAVLKPAFDEAEIQKLAAQLSEGIVQAKDNPRNVLGDYHRAFLYGSHPYGNAVDGTETSLAGLTAKDVKAFYRDYFGADRAQLTVVGDVQPKQVQKKLAALFGKMSAAGAAEPVLPSPVAPGESRVLLVNKSDTPQTWFMIGSLGPRYDHPDHAAVEVVRTVFGGRFTSWLNAKLRVETGLTYSARYNISPGLVEGPAYISTFTATESTKEAMDLALAQLDRLHKDGIGPEDLASAKAYIKGQAPYAYETAQGLAGRIATLGFYGVGRDRVDGFFSDIDAVDAAACNKAIAQYFQSDNLVITAIGVEAEVKDILGGYGKLSIRENAAPGFRLE